MANYPQDRPCGRFLQYFAALGLPLLVGFSRLYNGDHSMDQILYGWLLGLWLAFAFHLLLRDFILTHIRNLLYRTHPYTTAQLSSFYLISSGVFAGLFGILCLTFAIVDAEFQIP